MKVKSYLDNTLNFHNYNYKKKGFSFQRKFANEDVIRFISKNLQFFKNKKRKILDIGCGSGRHLNLLESLNIKCHGLDFSNEGLKLAKKNKKRKSTKLINDELPNMKKIKHNSYDGVIDCFTSYCLTKKDFEKYIKRISESIKKNGLFHCQIL